MIVLSHYPCALYDPAVWRWWNTTKDTYADETMPGLKNSGLTRRHAGWLGRPLIGYRPYKLSFCSGMGAGTAYR